MCYPSNWLLQSIFLVLELSLLRNLSKGVADIWLLHILAQLARGRSKRFTVQNFTLCDATDTKYLGECGNSVKVICKIRIAGTCVYQVACTLNMNTGKFECPDPVHMYTLVICCNFAC